MGIRQIKLNVYIGICVTWDTVLYYIMLSNNFLTVYYLCTVHYYMMLYYATISILYHYHYPMILYFTIYMLYYLYGTLYIMTLYKTRDTR